MGHVNILKNNIRHPWNAKRFENLVRLTSSLKHTRSSVLRTKDDGTRLTTN
jgi:hypothetical protein